MIRLFFWNWTNDASAPPVTELIQMTITLQRIGD